MGRKNSNNNIKFTTVKNWGMSCDFCDNQEDGKHYCLLHGCMVKNMDTVKCAWWSCDKIKLG